MPAQTKKRLRGRPSGHGDIPPQPDEPISPSAVYLYEEAAAHLQVSARTVRNLVYEGRLGHVELNKTAWRIQGRQLLDYIDRNARPAKR